MRRLAIAALAAGFSLTGCMTVGPDYQKPAVDVPAAWPGASTEAPVSVRWWTLYGDEHLNLMVEEALAHNTVVIYEQNTDRIHETPPSTLVEVHSVPDHRLPGA